MLTIALKIIKLPYADHRAEDCCHAQYNCLMLTIALKIIYFCNLLFVIINRLCMRCD